MEPLHEDIAELLEYDGHTGSFTWKTSAYAGFKKSVCIHKKGDTAGCKRKDGRGVIRVLSKLYLSSRLAWLLYYGNWPVGMIDHINGNCEDDRIANLRDVNNKTNSENKKNATKNKQSSMYLGVYLDKRKTKKKWRTAICCGGKSISLGYYLTEEEAKAAYESAKKVKHAGYVP